MDVELFKKKVDNFWFYNKYKVLAGVFIAVVLIVTITQALSNKKADVSMLFAADFSLDEQQTDAMRNALKEYTVDIDKNGEVYVGITPILVGEKVNPQMGMAGQQKMLAEISTGDSLIYLVNEEQYQALSKLNAFENIKKLYPNVAGIEDFRMSWENLAIRKLPELKGLPDDMYFVMRQFSGTLDKNNKKVAYVNASKDFFKKIISDSQ